MVAIVVSFVLILGRQARLHGIDSDYLVLHLQSGDLSQYRRHVLFMPLAAGLFGLLQPFGVGAFASLQILSALGVAIGAFATHRAVVWLLAGCTTPPRAVGPTCVAVAVACAPAVAYYGTAAELHGMYFGGLGLSWWAFARWSRAPGFGSALFVGGVCGLATALHAIGALLPAGFVLVASAIGAGSRAQRLQLLVGGGLAAATVLVAAAMATGFRAADPMQGAAQWLGEWGLQLAPRSIVQVLLHEWWLPFAPWSALAIVALFVRRARPWALAALAMLLVHLPVALWLLGRDPPVLERGAYLLPLALPAMLASAVLCPPRAFALAFAGGIVLTLGTLWPRWQPLYTEAFVVGVRQLRAERGFALLVDDRELEAVRIELDEVLGIEVLRSIAAFEAGRHQSSEELGRWFEASVTLFAANGVPLLVTDAAAQRLAGSMEPRLTWLWQSFVEQRIGRERTEREGLAGFLLRPR